MSPNLNCLQQHHHSNLYTEIENWAEVVFGLEALSSQEQNNTEVGGNNSDIPSSAVIHNADASSHYVNVTKKGANNGLVASGSEKDIYAFINFD